MYIALKSVANGKYVCAENAGSSYLIANRDVADQWETFEKVNLGNNVIALKSLSNCKYVAPIGISSWMTPWLLAYSTVPHPFMVVDMGNNKYALKCQLNNKFVCAENAGVQPLIANRDTPQSWESFEEVDRTKYYTYPHLVGANILFATTDDNKDHDTSVSVYVKNRVTDKLLAWIQNADYSGSSSTEYPDNSRRSLILSSNGGTPKSECFDLKVIVGAKANGNDTWRFNAWLTLSFSDTVNLTISTNHTRELTSKNSRYVETDFLGASLWNIAVRGHLIDKNGSPMSGVLVKAYDADDLGRDDLGSAYTDANGNFRITYEPSRYDDWPFKENEPDIYLEIFRDGTLIGKTKTWDNVKGEELDIGTITPITVTPINSSESPTSGVVSVVLRQQAYGASYIYSGVTPDPDSKLRHARIVKITNNTNKYPLSVSHTDRNGNTTPFLIIPVGSSVPGWNHEVEGIWTAQASGPSTSWGPTVTLQVTWIV